jgi:hypothetical protein
MTRSTVSNAAAGKNSEGGGGIADGDGTLSVDQSTISGNSTNSGTGASAIFNILTTSVSNSTISGNMSPKTSGAVLSSDTMTLSYVTIASNTSGIVNTASLTATGTIIADSTQGPNCFGNRIQEPFGFNLDSGTSCRLSQPTDLPTPIPSSRHWLATAGRPRPRPCNPQAPPSTRRQQRQRLPGNRPTRNHPTTRTSLGHRSIRTRPIADSATNSEHPPGDGCSGSQTAAARRRSGRRGSGPRYPKPRTRRPPGCRDAQHGRGRNGPGVESPLKAMPRPRAGQQSCGRSRSTCLPAAVARVVGRSARRHADER